MKSHVLALYLALTSWGAFIHAQNTEAPAAAKSAPAPEPLATLMKRLEGPPDLLHDLMKLVLDRDQSRWTDQDFGDHLDKPYVGGEPTFVPKDKLERNEFSTRDPREVTYAQILKMEAINKFYMEDYASTEAAKRFPCRTLASGIYDRGKVTWLQRRVQKFANLGGRTLAAFACTDLETGLEFRFLFTPDPAVIEAFIQPDLLRNMVRKREMIQTVLFDQMDFLGLRPDANIGMGHLHFGRGMFKSLWHMKNTMKYLYDHSELFTGVWERDFFNAQPMNMMLDRVELPPKLLYHLYHPEDSYQARWKLAQATSEVTPGVHFADEHDTMEIRGSRAFANAKNMITLWQIMGHVIESTSRLQEYQMNLAREKTPEEMVLDYFALVGHSVDRESARDLLLSREQAAHWFEYRFVPSLPNLFELSLKLVPPLAPRCDRYVLEEHVYP